MELEEFKEVVMLRIEKRLHPRDLCNYGTVWNLKLVNRFNKCDSKKKFLILLNKYFPIKDDKFIMFIEDMTGVASEYFDDKEIEQEEIDVEQPLFFYELEQCKNLREVIEQFDLEKIPISYYENLLDIYL